MMYNNQKKVCLALQILAIGGVYGCLFLLYYPLALFVALFHVVGYYKMYIEAKILNERTEELYQELIDKYKESITGKKDLTDRTRH